MFWLLRDHLELILNQGLNQPASSLSIIHGYFAGLGRAEKESALWLLVRETFAAHCGSPSVSLESCQAMSFKLFLSVRPKDAVCGV